MEIHNIPIRKHFEKKIYNNIILETSKYVFPPSNEAFKVITADPHHTNTKTVANINSDWESVGFALKLSDKESNKHKSSGPHKSPNNKIIPIIL